MYQQFRYSGFVKGVTAFILVLNLGLAYYLVAHRGDLYGALWALGLLLVGCVWPYLRSPKAVFWDDAGVILYRQYGQREFSSADYEISEVYDEQLIWGIRLAASGGYLGFWGLFWSQRLGRYWLYQTDTQSKHYLRIEHRDTGRLYYIALSDEPGESK